MADDFKFEDTLKNIFLAGVGAVSMSAEKSREMVDKLVEKGKITVEEGKALNQELKHKADEAADKAKAKAESAKKEAEEKVKNEEKAGGEDDISDFLSKLTPEQRETLRKQLDEEAKKDE